MGAGSSKKSQPPPKKSAPPKPVANVNNQEKDPKDEERGTNEVNQTTQKENEKNAKRREENEIKNKKKEKEKESNKKMKIDQKENMITYENESDIENDIDEVLKMPMAIEYPKSKKKEKKDKKKKTEEIKNNDYDSKLDRDLFNSNSNGYSNNEELPESYAQRLQRQQYKLQQDMLIRQKTMHRNSSEWDDDRGDEEDESYTTQGFDASKFRAANKGGDVKKDLFQTSSALAELETPRYGMPDPDMDDLQVEKRRESPTRNLPSYNQSEIDLMQELERDLL